MIATCGQWFSAAYRNACLACRGTDTRVSGRKPRCRCCGGSGFHFVGRPTGSHPFPGVWNRYQSR